MVNKCHYLAAYLAGFFSWCTLARDGRRTDGNKVVQIAGIIYGWNFNVFLNQRWITTNAYQMYKIIGSQLHFSLICKKHGNFVERRFLSFKIWFCTQQRPKVFFINKLSFLFINMKKGVQRITQTLIDMQILKQIPLPPIVEVQKIHLNISL